MPWIGPYTFGQLLSGLEQPRPPEANGVYLVSLESWSLEPTQECKPLYVGTNTRNVNRFRTRVGDLVADLLGFFVSGPNGHHSGGQTLHKYCEENAVNPNDLYIRWLSDCDCPTCKEGEVYDKINPSLNKKRPRCTRHRQ